MYCQCMICGNELGFEPRKCCNGDECGCMGLPIEPPVCSLNCEGIADADYKEWQALVYPYSWNDKRNELRDRRIHELSRTDYKIGDIIMLGCREYWWRILKITPRKYKETQLPLVLKRLLKAGDDMAPLVTAELIVNLAPQIEIEDKKTGKSQFIDMAPETTGFDSSWVSVVAEPENLKRPKPIKMKD